MKCTPRYLGILGIYHIRLTCLYYTCSQQSAVQINRLNIATFNHYLPGRVGLLVTIQTTARPPGS